MLFQLRFSKHIYRIKIENFRN